VAWACPKGYHLGAQFTPLIERVDKLSDTVRELVGVMERQEDRLKGMEKRLQRQEERLERQRRCRRRG
jgi:uncharacterized coiled-coil protein SlyX